MTKKSILSIVLVAALGAHTSGRAAAETSRPPAPDTGLLARVHFPGTEALFADGRAPTLQQIAALPASHRLLEHTETKLAATLAQCLTAKPKAAPALARHLVVLFQDVLHFEWYGEVHGNDHRIHDWWIALRLNSKEARAWETTLWQVAQEIPDGSPRTLAKKGRWAWQSRSANSAFHWRSGRSGPWTVLAASRGDFPSLKSLIRQIHRTPPKASGGAPVWLDGEADLGRLAACLGRVKAAGWPKASLQAWTRGTNVRWRVRLLYSGTEFRKLPPWQIPTNSVFQPLASFTVARGLAALWKNCPILKALGLNSPPDQICSWSQASIPFQIYAAIPCPDPIRTIRQADKRLPDYLKTHLPKYVPFRISWITNKVGLTWRGLPVATPFLTSKLPKDSGYLMGGLFPMNPGTNAAPPRLWKQIYGRPELLYYDWEITQRRIIEWRSLYQLAMILDPERHVDFKTPGQEWLLAIAPKLGNTVTEATIHSPRELWVNRKSQTGLDAIELVAAALWMDSPSFPQLRLTPPLLHLPALRSAPRRHRVLIKPMSIPPHAQTRRQH